jgi:RNA recognition motif-containing protein
LFCRWQEVKDLFRKEVGEVSHVELFKNESEQPRGCGMVEFASPELAKKAVETMNKTLEMKGRKIVVQEAIDAQRDQYGFFVNRSSKPSEVGQLTNVFHFYCFSFEKYVSISVHLNCNYLKSNNCICQE